MMKKLVCFSICLLSAHGAFANGFDKMAPNMSILFEEGRHFELRYGATSPQVSGALGPLSSGDVVRDIHSLGLGYKADVNERLSYALIYDQPFGAGINYTAPGYPISGEASLSSHALSGLLKYELGSGTSVYGGLRVHAIEGAYSVVMPFGPYTASTKRDVALGYILGAAYEKPEYGMRFALTYHSGVKHTAEATESFSVLGVNTSEGSV